MTTTHLVKQAMDPDFQDIFLPADMVYCGADCINRHSDHTVADVPVDGWCTVEFVLREDGEFEDIYGNTTLCPECMAHPDVAMAFLAETA